MITTPLSAKKCSQYSPLCFSGNEGWEGYRRCVCVWGHWRRTHWRILWCVWLETVDKDIFASFSGCIKLMNSLNMNKNLTCSDFIIISASQLPTGIITADGQQQNVMVYTTSYQGVRIDIILHCTLDIRFAFGNWWYVDIVTIWRTCVLMCAWWRHQPWNKICQFAIGMWIKPSPTTLLSPGEISIIQTLVSHKRNSKIFFSLL